MPLLIALNFEDPKVLSIITLEIFDPVAIIGVAEFANALRIVDPFKFIIVFLMPLVIDKT